MASSLRVSIKAGHVPPKGGHTTVLNFFNSQKKSDPQQLVQVKSWVCQAFDLSEDIAVMITQLQCTEEGCPPIETVIAIMETPGKPRQYKIHKPLAEGKADGHR